jgi:uncharacterized protein YqfA (UPF0365 family)
LTDQDGWLTGQKNIAKGIIRLSRETVENAKDLLPKKTIDYYGRKIMEAIQLSVRPKGGNK